eukprot:scaffold2858_cov659-Pavlova_lutheri.AAC.202
MGPVPFRGQCTQFHVRICDRCTGASGTRSPPGMGEAAPKRGPKVGDAASLWNFTQSPGWTLEEADVLRYALMAIGVGRWVQIVESNVLPGKLIQQLYGQTQRLIGQQSLAAYTGLCVDVDRIREDNLAKKDVDRKAGLVIYSGPNPTKEMKESWRIEAVQKYGLTGEQVKLAEQKLLELVPLEQRRASNSLAREVLSLDLLNSDTSNLSKQHKIELLTRLRRYSETLMDRMERLPAASGENKSVRKETIAVTEEMANPPCAPDTEVCAAQDSADKAGKRSRKENDSAAANKKGPSARPSRRTCPSAGTTQLDGCAEDAFQAGDIETLVAMGYPRDKAQDALGATGNVQLAIEWLLTNCAP